MRLHKDFSFGNLSIVDVDLVYKTLRIRTR